MNVAQMSLPAAGRAKRSLEPATALPSRANQQAIFEPWSNQLVPAAQKAILEMSSAEEMPSGINQQADTPLPTNEPLPAAGTAIVSAKPGVSLPFRTNLSERQRLENLLDAMVEDIMQMSDEEVMAEFGGKP